MQRCYWTDKDNGIVVRVLTEEKKCAGRQAQNGWKPSTWTAVAAALVEEGVNTGVPKTAEKCEEHWVQIKKWYREVESLRGMSGFGWDDSLKQVSASDEVWDSLLKVPSNKKYRKWRKRSFAIYDDVHFLVAGIIATGAAAFHAGAAVTISRSASTSIITTTVKNIDAEVVPTDNEMLPGVGEDDDDGNKSDLENIPPATPVISRKRERADSESPPPYPLSVKKLRRKISNEGTPKRAAEVISGVAGALQHIGNALQAPDTPKRRARATATLENDGDMSENEQVDVLELFTDHIKIVDTYNTIKKKATRTKYLRKMMQKYIPQ